MGIAVLYIDQYVHTWDEHATEEATTVKRVLPAICKMGARRGEKIQAISQPLFDGWQEVEGTNTATGLTIEQLVDGQTHHWNHWLLCDTSGEDKTMDITRTMRPPHAESGDPNRQI